MASLAGGGYGSTSTTTTTGSGWLCAPGRLHRCEGAGCGVLAGAAAGVPADPKPVTIQVSHAKVEGERAVAQPLSARARGALPLQLAFHFNLLQAPCSGGEWRQRRRPYLASYDCFMMDLEGHNTTSATRICGPQ